MNRRLGLLGIVGLLILAVVAARALSVGGQSTPQAVSPTSAIPATTAPASSSAKPTVAPKPTANAESKPSADRQQIASNATWAPGQLDSHFQKHGNEGPYRSVGDYDRAARDTIVSGTQFTYVDRESRAQRLGFYEPSTNRFTSVTSDGRRITTFFHPDRRDGYVRGLDRSTYR